MINIQIRDFKLYKVPPRWLFLKIDTNEGVTGWGEPILEGRTDTMEAAVSELMDYLLDKNPFKIEDHWQTMYRGGFYRGGPVLMSAIAGIDQALWDIKGKYLNIPVYELLGGSVRKSIRVYGWVGGDSPEAVAEKARERQEKGYRAVKMNIAGKLDRIENRRNMEKIVDRVATVRQEVDSDMDIALDFHGRVTKSLAPRLARRLEKYDPFFIEEPVLPQHFKALENLKNQTSIPIALGERLFSRWDVKPYLEDNLVDILQPDLSHAGGITESKKISDYAQVHDASIAFHCPLGPIALASCLQVDAISNHAIIQEQSLGIHYNKEIELTDYISDKQALTPDKGLLEIPASPGLGISPDEGAITSAHSDNLNWKNPIWRRKDGTLAEW